MLMSNKEKRLLNILNNTKNVRFKEMDSLLFEMGYIRRQSGSGSSHFVYSHPKSPIIIVLAAHGSNAVLPEYQVKKALLSIKNIEVK